MDKKKIMKGVLIGNLGRRIFQTAFGKKWTEEKIQRILPFLSPETTVIDIGCGNGIIAGTLTNKGWKVTPLDVADMSYFLEVKPVVYDGKRIPFEDNAFDTALLLTVLHHTTNPEAVLREAKRVANQILVIEDIYTSVFQQYLTYFTDTIVNMGFSSMTYQNKNDTEWKALFAALELEVTSVQYHRVLLFYRQATYVLQKKAPESVC